MKPALVCRCMLCRINYANFMLFLLLKFHVSSAFGKWSEIFPYVYSTSRCYHISPGLIYILHAINQDGCLCFRNLWLNRQFFSFSFLVYRTSTHTIFWWLSVFKLVKWKGNKRGGTLRPWNMNWIFYEICGRRTRLGEIRLWCQGDLKIEIFWVLLFVVMKLMNWSHQLKLWIGIIN